MGTPTPAEVRAAWHTIEESTKNTPDWFDLKKSFKDEFYIFVTGNSRQGYWRNYELSGCNYYGVGVTWDPCFIMQRTTTYTGRRSQDPLVFNFPDDTKWDNINHVFKKEDMKAVEGEVYGVPLRRLADIDGREGNGDGVKRIERWVTLLHPSQERAHARCFMHVVDSEFFLEYFSYSSELKNCNTLTYPGVHKDVEAYYAPNLS